MTTAEYLIHILYKSGVKHIFLCSGGGMIYLSDAVLRHGKIIPVSMHHEQALGYAAVGYAKATGDLAAVIATSGCGGTNMITPCLDAWQDSVSVIFITGQDNTYRTTNFTGKNRRQLGVQECDIIPIVSSITKYAVQINDIKQTQNHIDTAIIKSLIGRKGPAWLSIPLDIQCAELL